MRLLRPTERQKNLSSVNLILKIKEPKTESIQDESALAPYTVNTRIKHDTYGEGVIVGVETIRDDIHVIEVLFDNGTKSKLQLEVVVRISSIHLVQSVFLEAVKYTEQLLEDDKKG